jgi:hypothetical protein
MRERDQGRGGGHLVQLSHRGKATKPTAVASCPHRFSLQFRDSVFRACREWAFRRHRVGKDVDTRGIGERKRRRPSDGYARA